MKKDIENIMESYRLVGDLNGAVARLQDCLPERQSRKVIVEALEEFVRLKGKDYASHLSACVDKVLSSSESVVNKKKTHRLTKT